MKLTPIKFDAAFPDGLLEMDGKAFDWNGLQFVVYKRRAAYRRRGDPLIVAHAATGFAVCNFEGKSYINAAKAGIEKLDGKGKAKVLEAIAKASTVRVTTRLTP